jgi:DNA-binding response OmpR family regulator
VILADDEAITSNLAPFLERSGCTVHVAPDGEATAELIERLHPDACVLDVLMPRADGREVLRRLRAAGRWLPVILLTQVGESSERAIALDEGADDAELTLTPKAMLLLDYLVTHPNELLSRERLLELLWGFDFPVGTRAVDNRVAELRRALGDDPARPAWIATIPGQGYRFVAQVEESR